jgi:hypothetical protein
MSKWFRRLVMYTTLTSYGLGVVLMYLILTSCSNTQTIELPAGVDIPREIIPVTTGPIPTVGNNFQVVPEDSLVAAFLRCNPKTTQVQAETLARQVRKYAGPVRSMFCLSGNLLIVSGEK